MPEKLQKQLLKQELKESLMAQEIRRYLDKECKKLSSKVTEHLDQVGKMPEQFYAEWSENRLKKYHDELKQRLDDATKNFLENPENEMFLENVIYYAKSSGYDPQKYILELGFQKVIDFSQKKYQLAVIMGEINSKSRK